MLLQIAIWMLLLCNICIICHGEMIVVKAGTKIKMIPFDTTFRGNYVEHKEECVKHIDCEPNTYCKKDQCVPKVPIGEACTFTEECLQDITRYDTAIVCHPFVRKCTPLGQGTEKVPCTHNVDCQDSLFCIDGKCGKTRNYECTKHSECGTDNKCIRHPDSEKGTCAFNDLCRSQYYTESLKENYPLNVMQKYPEVYEKCRKAYVSDSKFEYAYVSTQRPKNDVNPYVPDNQKSFEISQIIGIIGAITQFLVIGCCCCGIGVCIFHWYKKSKVSNKQLLDVPDTDMKEEIDDLLNAH